MQIVKLLSNFSFTVTDAIQPTENHDSRQSILLLAGWNQQTKSLTMAWRFSNPQGEELEAPSMFRVQLQQPPRLQVLFTVLFSAGKLRIRGRSQEWQQ